MGTANGNRLRHRTGDVNEFGDTLGMLSSGGAGPGVMTSDQWFAGKHQQAENQKIWNQGIQHDKIDNQAIREANARGLTQGQLETALFGKPQSNQSSAAVPTNWEALLRGIAGVAPQSSSYGDFVGPRQLEGPVQPLSPLSVTYWKEHDPLKRLIQVATRGPTKKCSRKCAALQGFIHSVHQKSSGCFASATAWLTTGSNG